ncbi:hypothetical protein KR50_09600 [Jeotgalibacillus campisalis]|uniref:Uncharacterized protein n=1 Tax=Jeotgalibacillus campisalis TaxID=220754 RepID=A0A0C2SAW6_9BACL|nr:hypothetical protein KR50_09600 [Jeotgalibacillus campisalis]
MTLKAPYGKIIVILRKKAGKRRVGKAALTKRTPVAGKEGDGLAEQRLGAAQGICFCRG